jgi:hypothetical protein
MKRSTALLLASGAMAAAVASRRVQDLRALKAHIPGDVPEDHEDNTFGLPDGGPVRKQLKRFFREQLQKLVGFVATIGTTIPDTFPSLTDYNDPMASAMTPLIGTYWDRAGKGLRGRLGLDPDDWRVTDPNVHEAIKKQCLKFCASTNATTTLSVDRAREAVRAKLAAGLIGDGQTIPELTKAIRQVFTTASESRAETIARTETSRAVHTASLMSAVQSGTVSLKKWRVSANSCPVCVALAEKMPTAPLDQAFATIGKDADYNQILCPPAHPNCRCSMSYVPNDHAIPPVPAFVPTPKKVKPVATPAAAPVPPTPAVTLVAIAAATPVGAQPILPDRPIAERLEAYTEGDDKIERIKRACAEVDAQIAKVRDETRPRRHALLRALQREPDDIRIAAMTKELHELIGRFQNVGDLKIRAVSEVLKVPDPLRLSYDFKAVPGIDHKGRPAKFDPLGHVTAVKAEQARDFYSKVLAKGSNTEYKPHVSEVPSGQDQRSFYWKGNDQVHLSKDVKTHTIVHEIAHGLDHNLGPDDRRVGKIAKEFLAYRVGDERPVRMKDKFPNYKYDRKETGRKDRFDHAFDEHSAYYVGKEYAGPHSSEITSMGVELLYRDPEKFAKSDPEYCKFILGILDGSLR